MPGCGARDSAAPGPVECDWSMPGRNPLSRQHSSQITVSLIPSGMPPPPPTSDHTCRLFATKFNHRAIQRVPTGVERLHARIATRWKRKERKHYAVRRSMQGSSRCSSFPNQKIKKRLHARIATSCISHNVMYGADKNHPPEIPTANVLPLLLVPGPGWRLSCHKGMWCLCFTNHK